MTSISFFSLLPLYINFMRFLFTMFIPFYFMLSIIFENFSFLMVTDIFRRLFLALIVFLPWSSDVE